MQSSFFDTAICNIIRYSNNYDCKTVTNENELFPFFIIFTFQFPELNLENVLIIQRCITGMYNTFIKWHLCFGYKTIEMDW